MELTVNAHLRIPVAEFTFSVARSSGPGGQNVNKVNSKVVLHWNPYTSPSLSDDVRQRFLATYGTRINREGELVLAADEYRDQPRNRQACLDKLRQMLLAVARPPKPRRPTRPTRSSQNERKKKKRLHGQKKAARGRVRSSD